MKNLKSTRVTEGVQDQIRSFIATRGLQAGDMIPTEKALEEALGISRSSIREALQSLEAIGVIETRHGVGRFIRDFNYDALVASLAYSTDINVKNFEDVISVRMALEHTFIVRVVPRLTNEDIEELRNLVMQMAKLIENQADEDELISVHTAFHVTLYRSLDNRLLIHLIETFSLLQRSLTYLHEYRTSDTGEFVQLHMRLVDALAARDVELVELRLQEHFKDVIEWSTTHGSRAKEVDGQKD